MLYTETVSSSTLELLKRIMNDPKMNSFVLVGGTALALQIGHRISVDIDLFCYEDFAANQLREYLESEYTFETDFIAENTLKGEIEGIQIDCITHKYPWIEPFNNYNDIRTASIEDICAMKLNAIAGNGTRIKDFIDIAYLSLKHSLSDMLGFYEKKYSSNTLMPLKALVFFEDVNTKEPVNMMNREKINWNKIKKRMIEMEQNPNKVFSNI